MTLKAVYEVSLRILAAVLDAVGLLQVVQSLTKGSAQEHTAYLIESAVVNAANTVNSPTWGNHALLTQLLANNDQVIAAAAALTLQIEHLTDGTTPISLPPSPPSGYGGGSVSDIADQVWNGPQPKLPTTPADALQQIARSTNTGGLYDLPMTVGIFRVSQIDWPTETFYVADLAYPTFDPTAILASDTLLSFLTRTNPDWNVGQGWSPQTFCTLSWLGTSQVHYTTLIDEAGFTEMKASLGLVSSLPVAPVWPGLAAVTLGSSVALDRAITLTEEMDGVIVTLDTVPPDKPRYILGGLTATAHIGQVAFIADNGAAEYPQNLSFASEIYVPLALVGASAVVLRTVPGVTGTVQAWKKTV